MLVCSHITEKRKNLNTTKVGARSFQHWGAMAGFKQWNSMLNQTRDSHVGSMHGMDL